MSRVCFQNFSFFWWECCPCKAAALGTCLVCLYWKSGPGWIRVYRLPIWLGMLWGDGLIEMSAKSCWHTCMQWEYIPHQVALFVIKRTSGGKESCRIDSLCYCYLCTCICICIYILQKNYLHTCIFVCTSQNKINLTHSFWLLNRHVLGTFQNFS